MEWFEAFALLGLLTILAWLLTLWCHAKDTEPLRLTPYFMRSCPNGHGWTVTADMEGFSDLYCPVCRAQADRQSEMPINRVGPRR